MKPLFALLLIVMTLAFGVALTACDDDVSGDYFENETHRGYPGPGTTSPNRDD